MSLQTFKMLIEIGQSFPEVGKKYEFSNESMEYTGEVQYVNAIGWQTKGKIGVLISVTAITHNFVRKGPVRPKLTVIE